MKTFWLTVAESTIGTLLSFVVLSLFSFMSRYTELSEIAKNVENKSIKTQIDEVLSPFRGEDGAGESAVAMILQFLFICAAFSIRNGIFESATSATPFVLVLVISLAADAGILGIAWKITDGGERKPDKFDRTIDTLNAMAKEGCRDRATYDTLALSVVEDYIQKEKQKGYLRIVSYVFLVFLDFMIAFAFKHGENTHVLYNLIAFAAGFVILFFLFDVEFNIRSFIKRIIAYKKRGSRIGVEWTSYLSEIIMVGDERIAEGLLAFACVSAGAVLATSPIVTGRAYGNPIGARPLVFALAMAAYAYLVILCLISIYTCRRDRDRG